MNSSFMTLKPGPFSSILSQNNCLIVYLSLYHIKPYILNIKDTAIEKLSVCLILFISSDGR